MRQVKKSAILPATIGARIRAARQALGLSQVALAELLEVPQGQVSQWETGREPGPKSRSPSCSKSPRGR
jgi:DNA-binding transcriptional regulator YiaG